MEKFTQPVGNDQTPPGDSAGDSKGLQGIAEKHLETPVKFPEGKRTFEDEAVHEEIEKKDDIFSSEDEEMSRADKNGDAAVEMTASSHRKSIVSYASILLLYFVVSLFCTFLVGVFLSYKYETDIHTLQCYAMQRFKYYYYYYFMNASPPGVKFV